MFQGIEAHPLTDDSIFTWTAKIHGLKQTLWEGGVFRLYVKFDEHYKYRPPVVCFHTIPFHPNGEHDFSPAVEVNFFLFSMALLSSTD